MNLSGLEGQQTLAWVLLEALFMVGTALRRQNKPRSRLPSLLYDRDPVLGHTCAICIHKHILHIHTYTHIYIYIHTYIHTNLLFDSFLYVFPCLWARLYVPYTNSIFRRLTGLSWQRRRATRRHPSLFHKRDPVEGGPANLRV